MENDPKERAKKADTDDKPWQSHGFGPSSLENDPTLTTEGANKPVRLIENQNDFDIIQKQLENLLETKGLEPHPFLVGWYNGCLEPIFHLDYDNNTLAFVIISAPKMFENCFLPFIASQNLEYLLDPIDSCMKSEMKTVRDTFTDFDTECLHDFEMGYNRRPKILVQTAGHVAGGAYYYQKCDVVNPLWDEKRRIYGVSIHPKYGGWFALRSVVIFKNLRFPALERRLADDVLTTNEKRIEVLEKFTDCWRDGSYRDIIPVIDRYSPKQLEYFKTVPKNRKELLARWKLQKSESE